MAATNDTYQLQVIGSAVGNQHIHDLSFREVTPAIGAPELIAAWEAAAGAQYRALFHTTMAPCQVLRARQICGGVPLEAYYDVAPAPGAQMGTRAAAGEQEPSFMACHVKLRTGLSGRSRIGKFFLGGMMELDVAYNDVQANYLTLVQAYCAALAAAFVTPGIGGSWRLVVHSRKLAAVVGTACQDSSTPVTTLTPTTLVTTMRSRKTGHGL